jgi:acyl-CoA reductase-like NAD-dependent aldehyde dehydrogenase
MPISVAKGMIPHVAELQRYYAGWATKIHGETVPTSVPGEFFTDTVREPVRVVGAMTPRTCTPR